MVSGKAFCLVSRSAHHTAGLARGYFLFKRQAVPPGAALRVGLARDSLFCRHRDGRPPFLHINFRLHNQKISFYVKVFSGIVHAGVYIGNVARVAAMLRVGVISRECMPDMPLYANKICAKIRLNGYISKRISVFLLYLSIGKLEADGIFRNFAALFRPAGRCATDLAYPQ